MFTGIVEALLPVTSLAIMDNLTRFSVQVPQDWLAGMTLGDSIAIDGTCLTVAAIAQDCVFFDVISETLSRTTLNTLAIGQLRNAARAATVGAPIGGHAVSGHIMGTACITAIQTMGAHQINTITCSQTGWMKYILEKGFIAIDGASLTIVNPQAATGRFEVHLIPETLARTTLGHKGVGDTVNLEVDPQTQAIVDTVERTLPQLLQAHLTR